MFIANRAEATAAKHTDTTGVISIGEASIFGGKQLSYRKQKLSYL